MDKQKYPELNKLLTEIRSLITETFLKRKKLILSLIVMFIITIGTLFFFLIKNTPLLWHVIDTDYSFHFKTQVWAKLAAPVKVDIPIHEVFKVPFKDTLHVKVPFKTTMPMPVKQQFSIPITKPVRIYMDHVLPLRENVHMNTVLPVDSDVTVTVFGISKDIHIKSDMPVDMYIPVNHDFHFKDEFTFVFKEPVSIFVDHVFDVPVDVTVAADFPVDMILTVPMDINFSTEIDFEEKLPVIVEFDIIINPLKGIKIDGIKIDSNIIEK